MITPSRTAVGAKLAFAASAMAYLASRAPLLPLGLGSDPDAWSLASNARALIFDGDYRISRAPGHPVHEVLQSVPIAVGGPLAANVFTLLIATTLLLVVARIAQELQVPHVKMVVAALAFHPLLWIASADSTDFSMASLFAYSSLLAGLHHRLAWAGIFLGLAGGTRIESLAFLLPFMILARRPRSTPLLVALATTLAICYVPVAIDLVRTPWSPGDLVVSALSLSTRTESFAVLLWAACGLVPLLAASIIVITERRRLRELLSRRDPLIAATGSLLAAYLVVTFVHPSKASYYIALVPLVVLSLARLASRPWQMGALAASFLSYSLVYPDVFDRKDGAVTAGFRWNNGLVVKDWIARWNASHASDVIDRNRPRGAVVVVLAYWLPPWRYGHAGAHAVDHVFPGVPVHAATNVAYAEDDGAIVVHKLDVASASVLHAHAVPLVYGEGVDAFLAETHGYDIRSFGATELAVRDLAPSVSETFSLPRLLSCTASTAGWRACVSPARPAEVAGR